MAMTTTAGVGMSRHHNPKVAGREAAEQALQKADVDEPDFVFMYASIGYDQHSLLRAVRDTTGGALLSGCSVEGTIAAEDADESNFSVVVTAISSDELEWTNGLVMGLSADSRAVGQRVAQELLPHLSTRRARQPISTATTKSSPMGLPTCCSRVRHRLVGP
jgi:hypothetical protein